MENRQNPEVSAVEMEHMPFHQFFLYALQDIYWAENHLVDNMPDMIDAATSQELKNAISFHLEQTQGHVSRLEQVFDALGEKAKETKCKAMSGLLKEANDIIDETEDGTAVRDAALILAAQKIEHYEIATYGSLVAFSDMMGHTKVSSLLNATLQEEEQTNDKLTDMAETSINQKAMEERKS